MSAAPAIAPEAEEEAAPSGYDFDEGFQRKIAALLLRDSVFSRKTDGLIDPAYFGQEIDTAIVAVALDYIKTYGKSPDKSIYSALFKKAIADKRFRKDLVPDLGPRLKEILTTDISDGDFVADKCAEFAQSKALENAIIKSAELLGKGDFTAIRKEMAKAMDVGLQAGSTSYDYWKEIGNRTKRRIEMSLPSWKPDGISTGYAEIDKHLYHQGWGRKELSAIMGGPKAGKSMSLIDFGKNASLLGYNVFYATCEVSTIITADRLDANIADFAFKKLKDHPYDIEKKIKAAQAKAGLLAIHEYASGTLKCSAIRRQLEWYRSRGIHFDLIIVDYADIMAPEQRSNSPIEDSKLIWIDLRGIMFDYGAAGLTATQGNREGAKSHLLKATHVADDFNKVRTVDLLLSINADDAEKAAGEARLYIAASRNSEGDFGIQIKQDREKMKFITKVLGRC